MYSESGYGKLLSWSISTSVQHMPEAADKGKKQNRKREESSDRDKTLN